MKLLKKLLLLSTLTMSVTSCNGARKDIMGYFDYGIYPQKLITSENMINQLNEIASPDEHGYYHLQSSLYRCEIAHPWRSNLTFSDGKTPIIEGNKYWFKVDPVTWNIIAEDDGIYYVTSAYVIDEDYFDLIDEDYYGLDEASFKNSHILDTLHTMYADIFSDQEYVIEETILEYGKDGENNFTEKLFLLSDEDLTKKVYGFNDDNRMVPLTDYALCKGGCKSYWTRTQSQMVGGISFVKAVGETGQIVEMDSRSTLGIRPAFRVTTEPYIEKE